MPQDKSVDVIEQIQDIKENLEIQGLSREPEHVTRFYVGNLLQRIFSYLIGWTGTKYRRLKCNDAGNLQVSATGTTFDNIKVNAGTAVDAYGTAKDFGTIVSIFDVSTWDNPLVIKLSNDNVTYSDEIEIPANFDKPIERTCRYIHFKNKSAGNNSRFQFVGYY